MPRLTTYAKIVLSRSAPYGTTHIHVDDWGAPIYYSVDVKAKKIYRFSSGWSNRRWFTTYSWYLCDFVNAKYTSKLIKTKLAPTDTQIYRAIGV